MKVNKLVRAVVIIAIVIVNISCDQVSKAIIRSQIAPYANYQYLAGHFTLTRVENTGAFLSLGDNVPGYLHFILLSLLPAAFLVIGIAYLIRNNNISQLTLIGICFMIGGGAGNVFDRVMHGSVTDFLYLDFAPFHTGVFNVADLSISAGVIIVLIDVYQQKKKNKAATSPQEVS